MGVVAASVQHASPDNDHIRAESWRRVPGAVWQLEDVLIITLVAEFISPKKYILSVL